MTSKQLKFKYSPRMKALFIHFYAIYHGIRQLKEQFEGLLSGSNEKAQKFIEDTPHHGHLYAIPYQQLLVELIQLNGKMKFLNRPIAGESPNEFILRESEALLVADIDEEIDAFYERLSEDEIRRFHSLVFALFGNFNALGALGFYMYDLVGQAETSDDALLKAVMIDSAVCTIPHISNRIKKAEISRDAKFLAELSASITKSKNRRRPELDDLRLMLGVVDEGCGLKNLSDDDLIDLFVYELELLPDTGMDTLARLKWHIKDREKRKELNR